MSLSNEQLPPLEGFQVLERIGRGGAAQVYLAKSPAGRLVAIKVLSDGDLDDDDGALAREAKMCVRLNHPAIVQLRTILETGGVSALVFEYVPGVALGRVLRLCASRGVRLPDAAAWHIVERVLSALAYAHAQTDSDHRPAPIVHRDVTPANVLVDWAGEVKLGDFGLAKLVGNDGSTKLGMVKGTLGCMAPEQARGEPATERVDVYAAGLLAWRLATGRAPFSKFRGDDLEMLRAMRNPRLRPLAALRPDLPAPVLDATATALAVDPAARTITAEAFARVLREHFDLAAGKKVLVDLLAGWREPLERAVTQSLRASQRDRSARLGESERDERGDADSSVRSDESFRTLRYEEVALAFDDHDWQIEEPLPSDARLAVASTHAGHGDDHLPPISASVPPPAPVEVPPRPTDAAQPIDRALVAFFAIFAAILLYALGAGFLLR